MTCVYLGWLRGGGGVAGFRGRSSTPCYSSGEQADLLVSVRITVSVSTILVVLLYGSGLTMDLQRDLLTAASLKFVQHYYPAML